MLRGRGALNFIRKTLYLVIVFVFSLITIPVVQAYAQEDICSEARLRDLKVAIQNCSGDAQQCSLGSNAAVGGKVYLIGDSIAAGASSQLETAISGKGFSPVVVNALPSRTLTEGDGDLNGLGELERDGGEISNAKVVVIELGTNSSGLTKENITKAIEIVKSKNPSASIHWVNVGVDNSKRSTPMDGAGINKIISENSGLGYSVIDWASKVASNGDLIDGSDNLGVHLTTEGNSAFAETIAASLSVGSTDSSGNCVCSGGLSGSDNAEKIWNFFIEKGYKPFQVAGIMGNMQAESGLEPRLVEYGKMNSRGEISKVGEPSSLDDTPPVGSKTGYGLVQFTPATKIIPEAERLNMQPGDILFQLTLIWEQLEGKSGIPEKAAGDHLKATTTVEDASRSFEYKYERHAVNPAQEGIRIGYAIDFLTKFGSNTGAATNSSNTSTCAGQGGQIVGGVSLPVDRKWYDENPAWFTKPHHTYPAADIPVPHGTPIYAVTAGKVISGPVGGNCGNGLIIDAGDNIQVMYCHGTDGGSVEGARVGDTVEAGQFIMTSSYTGRVIPPGEAGAHLHLEIRINGSSVCPQNLLKGIAEGSPPNIKDLPSSGCVG